MKKIQRLIYGAAAALIVCGGLLHLFGFKTVGFALTFLGVIEIFATVIYFSKPNEDTGYVPKYETANRVIDVMGVLAVFFLSYYLDNWFFIGLSFAGVVAFRTRNPSNQ
ncbi:hypothetical protein [Austwickia chelonae]|uniref:hypothetical protein n=1 Tax=Austwickia chelonae TaxID=100225 RepID=UPI0013C3251B|nr:hypothetical protein [Austwickia chelonae]